MAEADLLDTFFGTGNRLTREKIAERPRLATLVDEFDIDLSRPGLLPRMREGSPTIEWYLLAGTDDDFRRAREEIKGFVGPTYARWDSALTRLDPHDAIDQAVTQAAPGRVLKFANLNGEELERMWEPLQRLRSAWTQRPPRARATRRPITAIVRDIDLALAAGASAQALTDLAELRLRGAISVQNARFIEIRALATDSRWREIVAHRDFADLCRIRRPWDVTEAMASAVNNTWFSAAEAALDRDAAVSAYLLRQSDLDQLLRVYGPGSRPAMLKAAAVRLAADEAPAARFLSLVERLPTEGDRAWVQLLSEHSNTPVETELTSREALDSGRFDDALRLALEAPGSVEDARVVLAAAYELGSIDAARQAIAYWRDIADDLQDDVLTRRTVRDAFDGIKELVDARAEVAEVTTWGAWLERVRTDPSWPSAAAVARCGELEFAATDSAGAEPLTRMSEEILAIADSPQRAVLLDGLPSLLRWIDRQDLTPSTTSPLHMSILEALALMDGWDAAGLEIAGDLVERILAVGVEPAGYGELLDTVDLIWDRMASRRHAAWLADVAEQFEFHPGDRERLIRTIVTGLARLDSGALPSAVRDGLSLTAKNLGVSDVMPEVRSPEERPADAVDSSGKTVGIYSLSPQVLHRVNARLRQLVPGLKVVTNSDHVATPALVSMARSVDLMVVAIGSAKHSATGAIDANRPDELTTLRNAFRGSTRIVEAVLEAVAAPGWT